MCSKRKVKIKINVRDYVNVMENLGVIPKEESEVREFTVEVEDDRKTYEYLLSSEAVIDWETIPTPQGATYRGTDWWKDITYPGNPLTTPNPGWNPGIVYCSDAQDSGAAAAISKIKTVNLSNSTSANYDPLTTTTKQWPSTYTSTAAGNEEVSAIVETIRSAYGQDPDETTILKILQAIFEVKTKSPSFRFSKRTMEVEVFPRVNTQEVLPDNDAWIEKVKSSDLYGIVAIVRAFWSTRETDIYEFLGKIFTK